MLLLVIDSVGIIISVGVVIFFIVITCLLIRWAVRADRIVNNQEVTIWLLVKFCQKLGVSNEELQQVKDHFKIKDKE